MTYWTINRNRYKCLLMPSLLKLRSNYIVGLLKCYELNWHYQSMKGSLYHQPNTSYIEKCNKKTNFDDLVTHGYFLCNKLIKTKCKFINIFNKRYIDKFHHSTWNSLFKREHHLQGHQQLKFSSTTYLISWFPCVSLIFYLICSRKQLLSYTSYMHQSRK